MSGKNGNGAQGADVDTGRPIAPTVDWDDSAMQSIYANVVNVSSTREEVNLFFGTNKTWKADEKREFHVDLINRIVLSPHAAKRMLILLTAVLKEYESRFGGLGTEGSTAAAKVTKNAEKAATEQSSKTS